MFCDELAGEARPGGEKTCIYRFDPCCNHWAEKFRWYQIARFCLLSSVEIWTLLAGWCNFCDGILWEGDGSMGRRNKFLIGQNFPAMTGFPVC